MPSPCPACAKPVSDVAAKCPHCGGVIASRDPRVPRDVAAKKPLVVDADEARALLAVAGVERRERPSFWRDFLMPHDRLFGAAWLLDAALIVATLPLVVGIVATLFTRRAGEPRVATVTGFFTENALVAVLGGVVVLASAWGALDVALPIVIGAWVAFAIRVGLRYWAGRRDAKW